jgi:hypothetical protein
MTRLLRAFTLAAALLALLAIVACGDDEGETTPAAQVTPAAQATLAPTTGATGLPIEMGIDPETTGNTASTLGTLEPCVRVDIPSPAFDGVSDHNIDVYVKGDVGAPVAYDAWVTYAAINDGCPAVADPETDAQCLNAFDDDGDNTYNDGCPQVGASGESGAECDAGDKVDDDGDVIVHVTTPGTNTLIKMPDAMEPTTDILPDSDGTFASGAVYLDPTEFGTPGDGVLVRLGLDIGGSGLVTFALNPPPLSAYGTEAGLHNLTLASAQLAINQDCPQ